MKKTLLISDPCILKIPIRENRESLINLKNCQELTVSTKHEEINFDFSKVRFKIAEMLIYASKRLPNGIKFLIEEGYRPITVQKKIFEEYFLSLSSSNPHWSNDKLISETSKYVAPPKNTPPHSTGGAIDIALIDTNGLELEMGSSSCESPDINQNRGFTYASNISRKAKMNRKILISALESVGFVNYPTEWWHWSYGDRYWAYHTNNSEAIYGSIDKRCKNEI